MQKIIPFVLVARWGWLLDYDREVLVLIAFIRVVVGSVLMCYGLSVKWLVILSSLVHTGWLMLIILARPGAFMFYFVVYGLILIMFLFTTEFGRRLGVAGVLLLLRRVPPMVGFLLKFYSLGLMGERFVLFLVVGLRLVVGAVVGYFINIIWGMIVQDRFLLEKDESGVWLVLLVVAVICGFIYF